MIGNDSTWRTVLRSVQAAFAHRIVTGRQIQDYLSAQSGVDLRRVFQQYLTTTKVPVLEYRLNGAFITYRWANVVPGFDMPVVVVAGPGRSMRLSPTEQWRTTDIGLARPEEFRVDENFYITVRGAAAPAPS